MALMVNSDNYDQNSPIQVHTFQVGWQAHGLMMLLVICAQSLQSQMLSVTMNQM